MSLPVLEKLRAARRVVIMSHVDPDGDALGTALGLASILGRTGQEVEVAMPGPVPRAYGFLAGADAVRGSVDEIRLEPDLVVAVDASSASRVGDLAPLLGRGVPVVNIDHHADNSLFGDVNWIDPTAGAASLMICEMAIAAGLEIPPDAASALYVGVLTDTGRFTFANTDHRVLRAAAELVDRGADPHAIAQAVYEQHTVPSILLLGSALATLDLREDGRVACLHVTREMIREAGARQEDADGFSTHARALEGVLVGVFLRETEEGNVKISLRSNEGVEIDGVARRFGGGGHPRASGAKVPGPIEEAKEDVLRAVTELLFNGDV